MENQPKKTRTKKVIEIPQADVKATVTQYKEEQRNLPAAYTPDALLAMAIEKGRGLDEISKLMDLQDRWEKKNARSAFLEAMSKFQSEVPSIIKGKRVNYATKDQSGRVSGAVDYNYAPLGVIDEAIREPMRRNGLSKHWQFDDTGNKLKVTFIVSHVMGHQETNTMEGDLDTSGKKNLIQQKASTITYLQRYTLIGGLGLTTADVDNDAQGTKETPEEKFKDAMSKMTPNTEEFGLIMKSVIRGTITVAKLTDNYDLSEEQVKSLKIAEDARNKANTTNNKQAGEGLEATGQKQNPV